MQHANNFFILTGGPGSGKTTLINVLKKMGYPCVDEPARKLIQNGIMPANDIDRFLEQELAEYINTYKAADSQKITFFDRGIVDAITHARLNNKEISHALDQAARTLRYNKKVFIAPPWQEIYCTDAERKQTYDEALQVFNMSIEAYERYGYELVHVPQAPVQQRVEFIMKHIWPCVPLNN